MFIVSLNYIKPLSEIEAYLPAHIDYLDRHYADSRAQAEAVIAEDPFYQAKLAEYQITQFIPTKTAADLAAYRETL